MKRAIDLAIAAGRKRQSPRTGFVHLFAMDELATDTIPIFENFCFSLSLFRQKSVESVLEGKELLERLLAFQTSDGNFPIYLHDFPKCYDLWMGLRIAPVLVQIQRHFGSCIGVDLTLKILAALERLMQFSATRNRPPIWEHRFWRLKDPEKDAPSFSPVSPDEWFHWLVSEQLTSSTVAKIPYHPGLQLFIGGPEVQEKGQPRPSPLEWFFAEKEGFCERLLVDHPAVLPSALLFPLDAELFESRPLTPFAVALDEGFRLFWGGRQLHSLSARGVKFLPSQQIAFELGPPAMLEKGDLIEAAIFCNISPETELSIYTERDSKKGTVFYLGDCVEIRTPKLCIELKFNLIRGEGDFCGQISRSNRPAQIACKGALSHEVFDWRIALRTLRRSPNCLIAVSLCIHEVRCSETLSTASPMTCIPLST